MTALCLECGDHQARGGHLCDHCLANLRRDLDDVARLWRVLHEMLEPGRGSRSGGRGKRTDPPAPLRLDILDLLDTRHIPDRDEIRSEAAQHINGWARVWCEEQNYTQPTDVAAAAQLLATHTEGLARQDWIDEATRDLRRALAILKVAAHDTGEPRIGTCWQATDTGDTCGGTLRIHTRWHPTDPGADQTFVVCSKCKDLWTTDDLAHVGRVSPIQLWESVTRIASMLDIPARTVRHWAATGVIRRNGLGQVLHADAWRHAHERQMT